MSKTGLPEELKSGLEAIFGMDLSNVQVHLHSALANRQQAPAFAQGNDIHIAPGQERHLPHEAWHVVQQRQGRVHLQAPAQQGLEMARLARK